MATETGNAPAPVNVAGDPGGGQHLRGDAQFPERAPADPAPRRERCRVGDEVVLRCGQAGRWRLRECRFQVETVLYQHHLLERVGRVVDRHLRRPHLLCELLRVGSIAAANRAVIDVAQVAPDRAAHGAAVGRRLRCHAHRLPVSPRRVARPPLR